ncbi:MAG: serine hydrolase, partial [Thermoanaerobaculia bacterium]
MKHGPACLLAAALLGHVPFAAAAPAIVTSAVENLYVRPDETSSVDDQVILGDRVEILEDAAGFAKVRTAAGEVAWIPGRALWRGEAPAPAGAKRARVTSNFAHVYGSPSFTTARPLLTAPMGARMIFSDFLEGKEGAAYSWVRVSLPDGRAGFVAARDVALLPVEENPPLRSSSSWISFGKRFLGAPYTWGGTTPLGFDCSGLMARIFSEHGVTLRRNSFEQAFQDPHLVPVAFENLLPGDLLFFGTEDKIDHEAMWIGDGTVLQSTRHNVPGVQITPFDSPFLKPVFRYARRLREGERKKISLNGKEGAGPGLDAENARRLESTFEEISRASGARFGIYVKDLTTGQSLSRNPSLLMHAASTMKTPVLLEVLRRVDAGTLKLSDELPVKNEFRSLVDGSPFSIGLEESDGPTVQKLGGTASLEFLAREMIVRSSNLATNILLSLVGPASVQSFTESLGAPTVHVRRCVEDSKAFEKGLNNETDAAGMGAIMEAVVRTSRLSTAAKAKAWEILAGQTF